MSQNKSGIEFRQFAVKRNLSWTKRFEYLIGTDPVDITDVRFRMQVREKYGGSPLVTLDTTTGGITKIDEINGVFEIALSRAQTLALTADVYLFDLIKITGTGEDEKWEPLFEGQLLMFNTVTQ